MTNFKNKVFEAIESIPRGKVATYGQIAFICGSPNACRAVGNILHKNPKPIIIPCHRVVNSKGKLAKHFAFGGSEIQKQLLMEEGVTVSDDYVVDLARFLWQRWQKYRHKLVDYFWKFIDFYVKMLYNIHMLTKKYSI